jgi:cytochrome c556
MLQWMDAGCSSGLAKPRASTQKNGFKTRSWKMLEDAESCRGNAKTKLNDVSTCGWITRDATKSGHLWRQVFDIN